MAITFNRHTWKDRAVQYPLSYTETENEGGGITHVPAPGAVAQEGTPYSAEELNRIEQGIADCVDKLNEMGDGPTTNFTEPETNQNLVSGELLNVSLGKISRWLKQLWEHLSDSDNPHHVTKEQLGLENVVNAAENDLTPTYTEAESDQNLSTGETLSAALGKIKRWISRLLAHLSDDGNPHETRLADILRETFLNELGSPAVIGTYTGGNSENPLVVNGVPSQYPGQKIVLGFKPSMVAICVPEKDGSGHMPSERLLAPGGSRYQFIALGQPSIYYPEDFKHALISLIFGVNVRGIVMIGPNANYFTGDVTRASCSPEEFFREGIGGAAVYDEGFIVQNAGGLGIDDVRRINDLGARYLYLAWR